MKRERVEQVLGLVPFAPQVFRALNFSLLRKNSI